MTCVIGMALPGGAIMACDQRITWGGEFEDTAQKIFRLGPWLMGGSGSARLGNLLAESKIAGDLAACADIAAVARVIRSALKEDGWRESADKGPADIGASVVIACGSDAWLLCGTFCYTPLSPGRPMATGSGSEYAQGAAHAYMEMGFDPETVMRGAIGAAIRFDTGCGGEPQIWWATETGSMPENLGLTAAETM